MLGLSRFHLHRPAPKQIVQKRTYGTQQEWFKPKPDDHKLISTYALDDYANNTEGLLNDPIEDIPSFAQQENSEGGQNENHPEEKEQRRNTHSSEIFIE
jgi:hypothetical protein